MLLDVIFYIFPIVQMFGSVGENKELKLGELARNIGLSFFYQNVRFLVVQVNSVADQPTEIIKPPFITQAILKKMHYQVRVISR